MLRQAWPGFLAQSFPHNDALELLLLASAAAATVVSLAAQLPFQNALLASVVIFILVLGVMLLNDATGIPLGVWGTTAVPHKQLFWVLPMIWVILLLNCRAVASLLLSPWRSAGNYGLRVLGLSTLLCLLFTASLEPFATTANHYWSWNPTRIPITWYSTPVLVLWTWTLISFIGQVLITPALIQKSPVPRPASLLHYWIWLLLRLLFVGAAVGHKLWLATGLAAVELLVVTACLFRVQTFRAWTPAEV